MFDFVSRILYPALPPIMLLDPSHQTCLEVGMDFHDLKDLVLHLLVLQSLVMQVLQILKVKLGTPLRISVSGQQHIYRSFKATIFSL